MVSKATVFMAALLFLSVLFTASCRPEDESLTLSIEPTYLVAGVDGVRLQVTGRDIPSQAAIRVGGQVLQTQSGGTDLLTCTIPRAITLPTDDQAAEWPLSVDLVDDLGRSLSEVAQLTVLRDYHWGQETQISSQANIEFIRIHRDQTGDLSVFYHSAEALHRVRSVDSGLTWQSPETIYTYPGTEGGRWSTLAADHVLVFTETNGVLTRHDLTSGQSSSVPAVEDPKALSVFGEADGLLHLVWETRVSENRHQVHHSRSGDFGASWTRPVKVLDFDGFEYLGMTGLNASGGKHVSVTYQWNSGRYTLDNGRISHDRGLTWTDGTAMNSSNTLIRGDGTLFSFGRTMYLPFMYQAYIRVSFDWGDTWGQVYASEDDAYIRVSHLIDDPFGNMLAVLVPSGAGGIRFARSLDGGTSWMVPVDAGNDLPVCDAVYINNQGRAMVFRSGDAGLWIRLGPAAL